MNQTQEVYTKEQFESDKRKQINSIKAGILKGFQKRGRKILTSFEISAEAHEAAPGTLDIFVIDAMNELIREEKKIELAGIPDPYADVCLFRIC